MELWEFVNKVHCLDAFTLLRMIPDASVDAYITDLPYGTTACSWDEIIPFAPMWAEVKRTLKPRGVFVTTASQPFTSKLVMSNVGMFKYEWIWAKSKPIGYLNANRRPMMEHESVLVFAVGGSTAANNKAEPMNYFPEMITGAKPYISRKHKGQSYEGYNAHNAHTTINTGSRYPTSILKFANSNYESNHPTQKPVALYEYLIRTYTQPDNLVVDFCCGSGTTALAARNLGRRFIAGDITLEYVNVARRLAQPWTPQMFLEAELAG